MRLSYFIGTEIDEKSTQDFLFFLNDCNKSANDKAIIDVYLRSPGGDLESYIAMKEAIEVSEIPVHIKATGLVASAAFFLLYFTENAIKSIAPTGEGLVHLITTSLDDRDLRKSKSFSSSSKQHLDILNNKLIADFKKYKVLTAHQIKEIVRGDDVILSYDEMYKIMLKCPFGTFLRDGETIFLENN